MESTQCLASLRAADDSSHRAVQDTLRAAGVRCAGKTRCAYLGQASPGQPDAFEPGPAQWVVTPGERRSQTLVAFRWKLPSGGTILQAIRANDAPWEFTPAVDPLGSGLVRQPAV